MATTSKHIDLPSCQNSQRTKKVLFNTGGWLSLNAARERRSAGELNSQGEGPMS